MEQHGNSPAGPHGDGTSGTGCSAAPSSDATSTWRVRRFSYDSASRLLTASNPESGLIQYAYDLDSNLLQKTSPKANEQPGSLLTQTISYCYDELHRPTGKAYSAQTCVNNGTQLPAGTAVVSYIYDNGTDQKGHLTHLADQAGSADFLADSLGRLTQETRILTGANNAPVSKSISYEYELGGSVRTLHYPSGAAISYSPDSAGRLLSAVDSLNNINYATGATYQADGQMTGFVSGGTITNTFSYNKRLQPINMSANAPSQTVFSIGYDFHVGNGTTGADNGNVFAIYNFRDRTRDQSFTYDSLNRLTSAQNAGTDCTKKTVNPLNPNQTQYWGNTYGYDGWGNLKTKSITKCWAENMSLAVGASNQITNAGYLYDSAGNMTTDGTDGVGLHYDPENRVDTATGGGVTTTYVYDSDGNRVKKSNSSTGTLYWYMTPGIIGESDLTGTMKSEYVFFNGERVVRRDLVAPTGVFYYFSDHLKTASVITDASGAIKTDSDYYPWGGEVQFVVNDSNHYKFTGKERDTETQLDYFGARYYSNGMGRFITPDWAAKAAAVPYAEFSDPQSLNLYGYVRNAPTTKFDADGHCPPCPMDQLPEDKPRDVGEFLTGAKNRALTFLGEVFGLLSDGRAGLAPGAKERLAPQNSSQKWGAETFDAALVVVPAIGEELAATRVVTKLVDSEELLDAARVARDALAKDVGSAKATVTGGYNIETGQVVARACSGGECAEDHVLQALGGDKSKVKFTEAVRPRTGKQVPVCERCEVKYGRQAFPQNTQFKSDQPKTK